jgi:hypothetical protein
MEEGFDVDQYRNDYLNSLTPEKRMELIREERRIEAETQKQLQKQVNMWKKFVEACVDVIVIDK